MMTLSRRLFLALPAAAAAAGIVRPAFAMSDAQQLVEKARLAFLDMITDDNYKEMRDYVKQSRALVIFPELIKGAFIIGAEGGSGVLVTRGAAGQGWSYPAFYTLASGSLGLQIGAKVSEIVFIIRTEKGLNAILDHKFKFGAEGGVTLVAVGIGIEGGSTTAGGADIVAFGNSAGLFAGVSLEGSYLDADSDWNALYYGQGATTKAIVLDRRYTNPGAEPIRQYLAQW